MLVLKWLDKAFWGRTDAQAAHQWEQAVNALDALIAAVAADRQRIEKDHGAGLIGQIASPLAETEPRLNKDSKDAIDEELLP